MVNFEIDRSRYDDYNKDIMGLLMDKIIGSVQYIGIDMSCSESLDIFDILIKSMKSVKKHALKFRMNEMKLMVLKQLFLKVHFTCSLMFLLISENHLMVKRSKGLLT